MSIYDNLTKNLTTIVNGFLRENSASNITNPEIEARFDNLPVGLFQLLKSSLKASGIQHEDSNDTTIYYKEDNTALNFRTRYILNSNGSISKVSKHTHNYEYIKDWNIRIANAVETEIHVNELPTDFTVNNKDALVRKRVRTSFILPSSRIDMTEVSTNDTNNIIYEVEVELTGNNVHEFTNCVADIFKRIHNSVIPYTPIKRKEFVENFNNMFPPLEHRYFYDKVKGTNNSFLKYRLNNDFLAHPRNLKKKDIVMGGLVGGEIKYTVTQKARGNRTLLVFDKTGIWLCYPPYTMNLILESCPEKLIGNVFEGEDIPPEHRTKNAPSNKHYFIGFDMLLTPDDLNKRRSVEQTFRYIKSHTERINRLSKFFEALSRNKTAIISFAIKPFIHVGDTMESLINAITKIKQLSETSTFSTDGFIFTPDNHPYDTKMYDTPLYKRSLSQYADICKLKPFNELTIDFMIDKVNRYVLANEKRISVPFRGSYYYPFDQKLNVEWDNPVITQAADRSIIEFEPVFHNDIPIMKPIIIRSQKSDPNKHSVAESIWDDINDPLDDAIFTGKSFTLMRRYFNSIKRHILSNVKEDCDLIDIGSGNGGDISKWKNMSRVLAIEPNKKHINEFKRRLEHYNAPGSQTIEIVEAGGEDTDIIVSSASKLFEWNNGRIKPLYISFMLSLSFFFKDYDTLKQLGETIKEITREYRKCGGKNVYVVFMTIEGGSTGNLLRNNNNKIKLGPCTMELSPNYEVFINIENSIVDNQTEYIVDLTLLEEVVPINFHLASLDDERDYRDKKLDQNIINEYNILSKDERTYTSLFVYGSGYILDVPPKNETSTSNIKTVQMQEEIKTTPRRDSIKPVSTNTIVVDDITKIQTPAHIRKDEYVPVTHKKLSEGKKMDTSLYVEVIGTSKENGQTMVRLAADQDELNFFHAFLKALYKDYQEEPSYKKRREFALDLRNTLFKKLLYLQTPIKSLVTDRKNLEFTIKSAIEFKHDVIPSNLIDALTSKNKNELLEEFILNNPKEFDDICNLYGAYSDTVYMKAKKGRFYRLMISNGLSLEDVITTFTQDDVHINNPIHFGFIADVFKVRIKIFSLLDDNLVCTPETIINPTPLNDNDTIYDDKSVLYGNDNPTEFPYPTIYLLSHEKYYDITDNIMLDYNNVHKRGEGYIYIDPKTREKKELEDDKIYVKDKSLLAKYYNSKTGIYEGIQEHEVIITEKCRLFLKDGCILGVYPVDDKTYQYEVIGSITSYNDIKTIFEY